MACHLKSWILFQYERRGTGGWVVFVYVTEVLKLNQIIGVKEEGNVESFWVGISYENDKLENLYKPPGMEAQYALEASLFLEIRKVKIISYFNYLNINWCDRLYKSAISGKFVDF